MKKRERKVTLEVLNKRQYTVNKIFFVFSVLYFFILIPTLIVSFVIIIPREIFILVLIAITILIYILIALVIISDIIKNKKENIEAHL